MVATNNPKNPAIQPFKGSLGAVNVPQIMIPKIVNQKYSNEKKLRAAFPMIGVKTANIIIPNNEPRKEPVVAIPMASPALPCCASGYPSTVVAALAGVPGILIKIAVRLPP